MEEENMELDHKEIALNYVVYASPIVAADEIQDDGHQVLIEFILENEGTWVIDPFDHNVTRPMDQGPKIQSAAVEFSSNGRNGCWIPEARSVVDLEPIFQDRILDDVQAYLNGAFIDVEALSHDNNNNNQFHIIELIETIKYYKVNRVVEQDMELARQIMDRFTMGDIDLDRRPGVDDADWVWVVDKLKDEYDEGAWGMAVEALEKVDNQALDGSGCAICIQDLCKTESIVKLPSCNHVFHEDCISEWFKKQVSCPLCRSITSHLVC